MHIMVSSLGYKIANNKMILSHTHCHSELTLLYVQLKQITLPRFLNKSAANNQLSTKVTIYFLHMPNSRLMKRRTIMTGTILWSDRERVMETIYHEVTGSHSQFAVIRVYDRNTYSIPCTSKAYFEF